MESKVDTNDAVETKSGEDLEAVTQAVNEVTADNENLKSVNADLETKAAELQADLDAKAAHIAELEAKAAAPAVLTTKNNEGNEMDQPRLVKTFMAQGIEGVKAANLQIGVDAQGGFALPEDLQLEIIKLEHDESPMRQVVQVRQSGTTDVKQNVSVGKANSGWVGETDTRPNTGSPELAQRVAYFGEVYANPTAYVHMLEDVYFDAESWLASEVAREFGEQEGQKWLFGQGGGTDPIGILHGLDLTQSSTAVSATDTKLKRDILGAYEVIHSGVDGALGSNAGEMIDFMRGVVRSLKKGYRKNAKWMMSEATLDMFVGLKNADGEYFLQRDITKAAADSLFGYEIVINEDMDDIPTSTEAGVAPILFGDFSRAYTIIDRTGVSTIRDAITVKGSVQFYTRRRTGSMKLDVSALKVVAVSKA